jgi:AhpC/TSA family
VKFKEKYGLPFTLLADPEHEVAERYGVWVEKNAYGKKSMGIKRSTFVVDADSKNSDLTSGRLEKDDRAARGSTVPAQELAADVRASGSAASGPRASGGCAIVPRRPGGWPIARLRSEWR